MNRLIYILLIILCLPAGVAAQNAEITFETMEYNFGDIPELGGPATFRFVYTNTGKKPLAISSVQTTCGCTSPAWSQEPVLPGKKGFIDVTFDPRDRTGSFSKRIIVGSNAATPEVTLYISGAVVPRPSPISKEYPYTMFDLRLKTPTIKLGKIQQNQTATNDIEVINPSKASLLIEPETDSLPPYIEIEALPSILKPGEKGIIRTRFNAGKYGQDGFVKIDVPILVNTYRYQLHFRGFVNSEATKQ